MYIKILLQYKEHLSNLEKQIDALAKEIEEYRIIQSIPGVGEKIAATIISEIGEIDRFNHPKKLVAFVGVDPSVHSSGKFTATINRITKHGSSRLRHALYQAVSCGLRKSGCNKLKAFYNKKQDEGKPYKAHHGSMHKQDDSLDLCVANTERNFPRPGINSKSPHSYNTFHQHQEGYLPRLFERNTSEFIFLLIILTNY